MQQYLAQFAVDVVRLGAWLLLLMAIFFPLERFFSLRQQKAFRKAFGTDLVYYFLSSLLPKLVLVAPLTLLAMELHRLAPGGWYAWVSGLPGWTRLLAAAVAGEIGAYWGHRWSHEIPWLWRFHAIHHSAEEIDWLVNSRAHPVDMVFTRMCAFIPMYVLGLAQPMGNSVDLVPVLVTIAGTIWGFFIHSNVSLRFGWLEWMVSSPRFHHWHHTNDGAERTNKNYAPMLPLIDIVFGTMYLPKREWPEKYGLDTPVESGLAGQLVGPFVRRD